MNTFLFSFSFAGLCNGPSKRGDDGESRKKEEGSGAAQERTYRKSCRWQRPVARAVPLPAWANKCVRLSHFHLLRMNRPSKKLSRCSESQNVRISEIWMHEKGDIVEVKMVDFTTRKFLDTTALTVPVKQIRPPGYKNSGPTRSPCRCRTSGTGPRSPGRRRTWRRS